MNSKLILVCLTFLFTGCSIFNADSDSFFFESNIGSKSFKADAEAYLSDTEMYMYIVGKKGDWENSENIVFGVADFDGTLGEYQVRDPFYYVVEDGNSIQYAAFDGVTSSVTITKNDDTFNQVMGSFAFEVIVEHPFHEFEVGEKIMITGNFSAKKEWLRVAVD